MKTILVLSTLLLSGLAHAVTVTPQEEMVVISDPNNSLVVYKTVEAMRIPNVPEGLSAHDAYDLVKGVKKEVALNQPSEVGRHGALSFTSPLSIGVSPTTFSDTVFSYEGGAWTKQTVTRQEKVEAEQVFTNLILIAGTVVFIFAVTFVMRVRLAFVWQGILSVSLIGLAIGNPVFVMGVLLADAAVFYDSGTKGKNFSLWFLFFLISGFWAVFTGILLTGWNKDLSHEFIFEYGMFILAVSGTALLIKWVVWVAAKLQAKSQQVPSIQV